MRQLRDCDFCGDDPTGVYEVLPASLAPTEAEQRRIALCADCRGTLESVLEPLLARLDGSEPARSSASEPEPVAERGPVAEPDPAPEPSATDTVTEPEASVAPDADANDADGSDPDGSDADTETVAAERAAVREEVRRVAPRRDRPPGYDKVLRLLQNREGAMPRDDLRTLVTNAYGLGDDEFDAVVDAAVENGDLAESRKGLRTT